MTERHPEAIVTLFAVEGELGDVTPYGNGHINDTYLVRDKEGKEKYILQRINTAIFRDPALLMHNFASVTEYLRATIAARGGDTERETINLIPTKKGETFHVFRYKSDSDNLGDDLKGVWLIGWSGNDGGTFSNFDKYADYEKKTPEKTVKYIRRKLL